MVGRLRVAEEDKKSEEDEARGSEEEAITDEGWRVETDRGVKEGGREEESDGTRDDSEAVKEGIDGGRWSGFSFPSSTPENNRKNTDDMITSYCWYITGCGICME